MREMNELKKLKKTTLLAEALFSQSIVSKIQLRVSKEKAYIVTIYNKYPPEVDVQEKDKCGVSEFIDFIKRNYTEAIVKDYTMNRTFVVRKTDTDSVIF